MDCVFLSCRVVVVIIVFEVVVVVVVFAVDAVVVVLLCCCCRPVLVSCSRVFLVVSLSSSCRVFVVELVCLVGVEVTEGGLFATVLVQDYGRYTARGGVGDG